MQLSPHGQGVAAHKEGRLEDAERLYRAILQSQSLHPDANHNLGVLAVSVNKADAALPLFKTAPEANPKIEQFWLSYIDALIKEKQFETVKQVLSDGKKQGVAGDKVDALEQQLKAVLSNLENKKPDHNEFSPAIELRETGKYQEAQEWLNEFIGTHPNEPETLSLLSQVLLLDKKDAESEKVLLTAASLNSELPSIYRNQARLLLKQSKPAEALEKGQSGYERSSNDPESWLVLAACLGANQKDQEALSLIGKALEARPKYAEAFANRALIRLRGKDISGAIKDAEMSVSFKPHLTQMWALLGSLRYQSNNLSGAIEALRNAHENEPNNIGYMINLGEFLRQDQKLDEAISLLENAVTHAPDNASAWANLGAAFQQAERTEEAITAYKKSLAFKPESAEVSANLGALQRSKGELAEALERYEKAIQLNPEFAAAYLHRGITLQELGQLNEAVESYGTAIQLRPEDAGAYFNRATALQQLGRLSEALLDYEKVIQLRPEYADAYSNRGNVLKDLGQLDGAAASYEKAIQIKPDLAVAYYNLGIVLNDKGLLDDAIASYEKAIQLKPDYTDAYYNRGNVLKELTQLDRAIASYDKAIQLRPDHVQALSNLGSTQIELGQLNDAVTSFGRALQIKSDFAEAFLNRGTALQKLGYLDEAIEDFDRSNLPKGRAQALETLYALGNYDAFYKRLSVLTECDQASRHIAAISAFAAEQLNCENPHLFCKDPLSFLHIGRLEEFSGLFLDGLIRELKARSACWEPVGLTTKFGFQTAPDLFVKPTGNISQLQKIIAKEISVYYSKFKAQKCLFMDSWPKKTILNGWFVRFLRQGHQESHMHSTGWLSRVVYLKVTESDEGVIKFGLHGYDYPILGQKPEEVTHRPRRGDIVLFPSSLFHRTEPIQSDSERLVVAFDLLPGGP